MGVAPASPTKEPCSRMQRVSTCWAACSHAVQHAPLSVLPLTLFAHRVSAAHFRLPSFDMDRTSEAECDSICYLQTQQSAKSFSYATQRKQQFEQAERLQAVQQANRPQHPSIKYDNINQFSQKVELYRGRYAGSHMQVPSALLQPDRTVHSCPAVLN